jgi:hypothetical protein
VQQLARLTMTKHTLEERLTKKRRKEEKTASASDFVRWKTKLGASPYPLCNLLPEEKIVQLPLLLLRQPLEARSLHHLPRLYLYLLQHQKLESALLAHLQ